MAQPKLRSEQLPEPAAAAAPEARGRVVPVPTIAAHSPARVLHDRLHQFVQAEAPDIKWSRRRRLVFILTSASGLWAVLIGTGLGIAHLIA